MKILKSVCINEIKFFSGKLKFRDAKKNFKKYPKLLNWNLNSLKIIVLKNLKPWLPTTWKYWLNIRLRYISAQQRFFFPFYKF